MKVGYEVRCVFLPSAHTPEDYNKALEESSVNVFSKLSEAKDFTCCSYLQRLPHGYTGRFSYWEYVITRVRI